MSDWPTAVRVSFVEPRITTLAGTFVTATSTESVSAPLVARTTVSPVSRAVTMPAAFTRAIVASSLVHVKLPRGSAAPRALLTVTGSVSTSPRLV